MLIFSRGFKCFGWAAGAAELRIAVAPGRPVIFEFTVTVRPDIVELCSSIVRKNSLHSARSNSPLDIKIDHCPSGARPPVSMLLTYRCPGRKVQPEDHSILK